MAAPGTRSCSAEARAQAVLCFRLNLRKGCTVTFSTSQNSTRVLDPLALPSADLTRLCPEMVKRWLKAQKGKSQPKIFFKTEANLQCGRKLQ